MRSSEISGVGKETMLLCEKLQTYCKRVWAQGKKNWSCFLSNLLYMFSLGGSIIRRPKLPFNSFETDFYFGKVVIFFSPCEV